MTRRLENTSVTSCNRKTGQALKVCVTVRAMENYKSNPHKEVAKQEELLTMIRSLPRGVVRGVLCPPGVGELRRPGTEELGRTSPGHEDVPCKTPPMRAHHYGGDVVDNLEEDAILAQLLHLPVTHTTEVPELTFIFLPRKCSHNIEDQSLALDTVGKKLRMVTAPTV